MECGRDRQAETEGVLWLKWWKTPGNEHWEAREDAELECGIGWGSVWELGPWWKKLYMSKLSRNEKLCQKSVKASGMLGSCTLTSTCDACIPGQHDHQLLRCLPLPHRMAVFHPHWDLTQCQFISSPVRILIKNIYNVYNIRHLLCWVFVKFTKSINWAKPSSKEGMIQFYFCLQLFDEAYLGIWNTCILDFSANLKIHGDSPEDYVNIFTGHSEYLRADIHGLVSCG